MSNIATSQSQFDAAYKAAQPKAVQALMAMPGGWTARQATAIALVKQGYVIDNSIMVWGWDPWIVTQQRIAEGYTWVPSAGQPPVVVAPGLSYAGQMYEPQIVPAGGILVTLDMDLLPQIFAAPSAAVVATIAPPVAESKA
jgi:hypothetical protein